MPPPPDRPSPLLWYLAGGIGPPPTTARLKEWKARDRACKAERGGGGFWSEVWRGVGWRFRRKKKEGEKVGEIGEAHAAEGDGGAEGGDALPAAAVGVPAATAAATAGEGGT